MHFSVALLPLLILSTQALPVPRPRHVGGVDIHPQAQLEPTPSANFGSLPTPSPSPSAEAEDKGRKMPAGKMTNAQRMAMGLGPNAPTRRSSAPRRRASQVPLPVANNNQDKDVVIRVISTTGEDLGTISNTQGEGDHLTTFGPGETPMKFSIPASEGPFELGPSDEDDGLFGPVRKLLGAIPHMPNSDGAQMGPGSPNFANIGEGSCDSSSGLLGLTLPPLPLVDSAGGLFSGLPGLLAAKLPSSASGLTDSLPLSDLTSGSGVGGLDGLLNIVGPLGGGLTGGDDNDSDASSSSPVDSLTGGSPLSSLTSGGSPLDSVTSGGGGLDGLLNIVGSSPLGSTLSSGSYDSDPSSGSSPSPLSGLTSAVSPSESGSSPLNNGLGLLKLVSRSHQDETITAETTEDGIAIDNNVVDGSDQEMDIGEEEIKENTRHKVLGLLGSKKRDLASTLTDPTSQPAQKAIWSCDEAGNLGAVWKNPGGDSVPARFFTGGPCAHTICLTAAVDLLKSIHGEDIKEVNLVAGVL